MRFIYKTSWAASNIMWSKGTKQSGIQPLHLLSYSVYWLLKHFYQPPYFPSCILFSCTQYWLLWDITHACSLYCCISIYYSVTKKPADKPQTVQTSIYPVIFYSDSVGLFFFISPPPPQPLLNVLYLVQLLSHLLLVLPGIRPYLSLNLAVRKFPKKAQVSHES